MEYSIDNFHPNKDYIPNHIGLIPDGTGRWATINNVDPSDAYYSSMKKVAEYVDLFFSYGINTVSVYFSSTQNFKRSPDKIAAFNRSQASFVTNLLPPILSKNQTQFRMVGNIDKLPNYYGEAIKKIENNYKLEANTKLYLCIAYNPLEEIIHAVNSSPVARDFIKNLWVLEPLDLIIRTSGANLLSNFLPLQAGYARLYTINKLFNETTIENIIEVLFEFQQISQHRRYGE